MNLVHDRGGEVALLSLFCYFSIVEPLLRYHAVRLLHLLRILAFSETGANRA